MLIIALIILTLQSKNQISSRRAPQSLITRIIPKTHQLIMFSNTIFPSLTGLAAILAITTAAPLEASALTKRDGAMFTLSVFDVLNNMPGYNNTPISARNGNFYIGGGGPATTCPPTGPCPSDPATVFQCVADNANTTCYLVSPLLPYFITSLTLTPQATQSGKQPIFFNTEGALSYAPSYMYGHLSPAAVPEFEHRGDSFAATQFRDNNAASFFNQNWFGCASTDTLNPEYAAPYQLFFALSAGSYCPTASAWIELVATNVGEAEAYAYALW